MRFKAPLYHGTTSRRLPDILDEGLKVWCVPRRYTSEYYKYPKGWTIKKKFTSGARKGETVLPRLARCGVFLTDDPLIANSFAKSAASQDRSEEVVLQVDCLAKGARFGGDGWGYFMTDRPIPPKCIKEYGWPDMRETLEKIRRMRGYA